MNQEREGRKKKEIEKGSEGGRKGGTGRELWQLEGYLLNKHRVVVTRV